MSSWHFRRRRLGLLALSLAVAVVAIAGCGAEAAGPRAEGPPKPGGNLVFGLGVDPVSLNPQGGASGNGALYVTRQLVDSLTEQDPATGGLVPWLATKWEVSPDAKVFTFTLREGVTFSDGSPVTAQSVKDNFDSIVAAGAKASGALPFLTGYARTVVVDPLTAQVEFNASNGAFLQATSSSALGLLAPSTLAVPFEERASGKLVGSGPFVLDHYTPNSEVVLRKRAGYDWAPETRRNRGEAYVDTVTFKIIPEAGARTGALQSGQIAAASDLPPQYVGLLRDSGYSFVVRPNPGLVYGFSLNQAAPVLADSNVRRALRSGIDAAEVRDTLLTPDFAVATSVLAKTTPGWLDQSASIGYDPDEANRLLDEAGWRRGADGIRVKDGRPLVLNTVSVSNFGPNQSILELLQQQLKRIGIRMEFKNGTVPEWLETLKTGAFDLAWGNFSRADGDVLRMTYAAAGNNSYRIDDPELEAALRGQQATADPQVRAQFINAAERLIVDRGYAIPVVELTSIIGQSGEVHGIEFGADSRLQQLNDAWVSGPH
ncbi:ABC transporter substrate-binding protein [Saccharopolyspora indica]|uniref:ABC transporter substrate-binding protein n=1 Tax=Saccharopolyspora indica TaxID=1229659 RepID=UPI0022EACAC2|nr:ABC transporter substrate-binding protein [Saccharopolyspora indica]MDA3644134.1 ABC transporter substrate-binding protein [Saccharopolyspora indica]